MGVVSTNNRHQVEMVVVFLDGEKFTVTAFSLTPPCGTFSIRLTVPCSDFKCFFKSDVVLLKLDMMFSPEQSVAKRTNLISSSLADKKSI